MKAQYKNCYEPQHLDDRSLGVPRNRTVFESMLASATCSVRASTASSYSHRPTTRRATYSKTSATPTPVLADVKNSFVPHCGGAGYAGRVCTGDGAGLGVVHVVDAARPFPFTKRLGVMVCVSDTVDDIDGFRWGERTGEWLGDLEDSGEDCLEMADGGAGDDRADSNTSKKDEEGVWYTERVCVVVIVPMVPPRNNVERLRERECRRRRL